MSVPRADSDICLNPGNTFLVKHRVTLPNELHDVVPCSIKSGASTVHGMLYPAFPDQSLHVGYLR